MPLKKETKPSIFSTQLTLTLCLLAPKKYRSGIYCKFILKSVIGVPRHSLTFCSSLVQVPLDGTQYPHRADVSLVWLASTGVSMCGCPLKNIAYS